MPEEFLGPKHNAQQLKKVGIKHEAILNFIIANPQAQTRDIAAFFDVSPGWVSIVINSDAFRARLAERQEKAYGHATAKLRDKLEGVAHQGVERLAEAVENSSDPKFLLDATDKVLHRLGFAPRGPGNLTSSGDINIQQNFAAADPAQLEQARELMEKARALRNKSNEPALIENTADAGPSDAE